MKNRKTLFWRLLPSYWVIVIASLLLFTIYAYTSVNSFYKSELEKNLQVRANLLAEPLNYLLAENSQVDISELCENQSSLANETRFTVINPQGVVLGDSHENPELMKNHRDREEIRSAIDGDSDHGKAVRYSQTLQQLMMYVAVLSKILTVNFWVWFVPHFR